MVFCAGNGADDIDDRCYLLLVTVGMEMEPCV